jgi:hypothetical protein
MDGAGWWLLEQNLLFQQFLNVPAVDFYYHADDFAIGYAGESGSALL